MAVTRPIPVDVKPSVFEDRSDVNPGRQVFITEIAVLIYRGIRFRAGTLAIGMGTGSGAKRRLDLTVSIYANNMRAKRWTVALTIGGQALRVSDQREEFIY